MVKVFVYGTLKKGYALNSFLKNSVFLGKGVIVGFELFSNGSYPMIVHSKLPNKVTGEVYEIEDETLKTLDMIEGAYEREPVWVKFKGKMIRAFTYVWYNGVEHLASLPSGIFEGTAVDNYSSDRETKKFLDDYYGGKQ